MPEPRLLSAAVLIPLVAWSVLALPTGLLAALLALPVLLGGWEWGALVPLRGALWRAAYTAALAILLAVIWYLAGRFPGTVDVLLAAAAGWWLGALFWLRRPERGNARRVLKSAGGLLTLAPAWLALLWLHGMPEGPALVLALLVLVWAADSGAWLIGRRWGRHRLAPRVSPGKTWEGIGGALAGGALVAAVSGWYFGRDGAAFWWFFLLCLAAVALSVIGDLLESLLKRQRGLKDSGTLIPGHGGVLDRVDSLTAAAPFFLLGLRWLGI